MLGDFEHAAQRHLDMILDAAADVVELRARQGPEVVANRWNGWTSDLGEEAEPAGPDTSKAAPTSEAPHLGDIIVSVERTIEQARRGAGGQTGDVSWAPADELRLLITHGGLHLCGWDHAEPEEETAMRALERRLLARGVEGSGRQ